MYPALSTMEKAVAQFASSPLGTPGRLGHVLRCRRWWWLVTDLKELDVKNQHPCGFVGLAAVRKLYRDPDTRVLADRHELQRFGPAGDNLVEGEFGWSPARDAAVKEFAVGCPSRVVHLYSIVRGRVVGASSRLQYAIRKTRGSDVRVSRDAGDIGRHRWGSGDLEQFNLKDQHALRSALATVVGQFHWDPRAHFLADLHEGESKPPAFDDLVDPKRRRFSTLEGAVEEFAVGRPALVVHRYGVIVGRGISRCAFAL